MVDQAQIDRIQNRDSPATFVAHSVGDFAHDLTVLAELQAKLLAEDVKEGAVKTAVPVGLAVVGLMILLGSVPIALVALALVLQQAGMLAWSAFLVSSLIGLVLAGALFAGAWLLLRNCFNSIERSREEFVRNFNWIKNVLKKSGRSWRTQSA